MRVKGKFKRNNWWRNLKIRVLVFIGRDPASVGRDYDLTRQRVNKIAKK